MKFNKCLILPFFYTITVFSACSKSGNELGLNESSSSLTLVNLISGSNGIITNFSGGGEKNASTLFQYYSSAAQVSYGSFKEFSSYTGSQPLSIASATDTLQSEWSGTLSLAVGSIQSLYFFGPDTLHIDTLLTSDELPYYPAGDSVVGVRFVNLANQPDGISIDIQANSGSPIVTNMPFKGVSAFNALPATKERPAVGKYVFEFRDAVSDSLLATYTYSSFKLFKNVSIVLNTSEANGQATFATVLVNDY